MEPSASTTVQPYAQLDVDELETKYTQVIEDLRTKPDVPTGAITELEQIGLALVAKARGDDVAGGTGDRQQF